jgi:hypothetical protein
MSECLTNIGISQNCDIQTVGGLKRVWIGEFSNLDSDEIEYDSDNIITGLTSALSSSTTLKEYVFDEEKAYYNEPGTYAGRDDSIASDEQLYMTFKKFDNDKRNALMFFRSTKTFAIIQDNNDYYRLVGISKGLYPTADNANSGAASGEFNGLDITLSGFAKNPAPFIESKTVFSSYIS